jgi:hypothetical protein
VGILPALLAIGRWFARLVRLVTRLGFRLVRRGFLPPLRQWCKRQQTGAAHCGHVASPPMMPQIGDLGCAELVGIGAPISDHEPH